MTDLTQPTIGRHIDQLEQALGVCLLTRFSVRSLASGPQSGVPVTRASGSRASRHLHYEISVILRVDGGKPPIVPIPRNGVTDGLFNGAEVQAKVALGFDVAEPGAITFLRHQFDCGEAQQDRLARNPRIGFLGTPATFPIIGMRSRIIV
jgi:hypothetical protein